jgi:hypothetical protein
VLGECPDISAFLESSKILPSALVTLGDQDHHLKNVQTEQVFIALHELPLDKVGLAISCDALKKIAGLCFYSHHLLRRILLDCERRLLREKFAGTVAIEFPPFTLH